MSNTCRVTCGVPNFVDCGGIFNSSCDDYMGSLFALLEIHCVACDGIFKNSCNDYMGSFFVFLEIHYAIEVMSIIFTIEYAPLNGYKRFG